MTKRLQSFSYATGSTNSTPVPFVTALLHLHDGRIFRLRKRWLRAPIAVGAVPMESDHPDVGFTPCEAYTPPALSKYFTVTLASALPPAQYDIST